MNPMVIVLGVVIVLAVVILFWGIASAGAGDRAIETRLEEYTSGVVEPTAVADNRCRSLHVHHLHRKKILRTRILRTKILRTRILRTRILRTGHKGQRTKG